MSRIKIRFKTCLVLVGAVEDVLSGEPLGEDEVERGLAGGAGHGRQEVQHGRQLAVDQLRVHHQQTLRKGHRGQGHVAYSEVTSDWVGLISHIMLPWQISPKISQCESKYTIRRFCSSKIYNIHLHEFQGHMVSDLKPLG